MTPVLISNNPLVWERYPSAVKVQGTLKDVLLRTRDGIHRGMKLLTHPLTGSIKPNQSPYKSVLLIQQRGNTVDLFSLQLIEEALATVAKFRSLSCDLPAAIKQDYQVIDLSFVVSAWDSLRPLGITEPNDQPKEA
ncbi:MAG TPA: GrdX protein [Clostridia bacterium]|nr:GrdX protein [Clostridia bacterium]